MAGSVSSIGHVKTDPLRNFKFLVNIYNPARHIPASMGFMSVSGLNITTDVIPYRQGGHNTTTQKMPGQSDFAPITLSKGVMLGDSGPMRWMKDLFSVIQGAGGGYPGLEFRSTVDVHILDHPVTSLTVDQTPTKAIFRLYNCWPTSLAFSDLDAGANSVFVMQMTLAHEGWDLRIEDKLGKYGVHF